MENNSTKRAKDFYTEEILDLDAWFSIADTDYKELLNVLDIATLFSTTNSSLQLLDIGCGTGRFPELTHQYLPKSNLSIEFDFLDPAPHCLKVMRESLISPYKATNALQMSVESLDKWKEDTGLSYDIIWAIHSLYFFDAKKIPAIIMMILALLKAETGIGLIYIFNQNSFYSKLFDVYRQVFPTNVAPYLVAEQFIEGFKEKNISFQIKTIPFYHTISEKNISLLEKYLHKCVLSNEYSLTTWKQNETLYNFLENYHVGDVYAFPQEMVLLQFGDITKNIFL